MFEHDEFPRSLTAPSDDCVAIGGALVREAIEQSRRSPRGRIIQPLHKTKDALLQRMLNSLQQGTYIRPHRHAPDRAESIVVLSGSILYVTFDDDGSVRERLRLAAGSGRFGVDTEGGVYHSFTALEPDTVLFEVKPGPYDPETDKEFASWAPEEGHQEAAAYLLSLLQ